MELFIVVYSVGGFTREDNSTPEVAGIFTKEKIAEIIRKASGPNAKVVKIELDKILPGHMSFAKEVLNIDLEKILKEEKLGFEELSEFDRECIMSAEEFLEDKESGFLIPSDGTGYWATESMVSKVWCFNAQPEWATHVCWYNN